MAIVSRTESTRGRQVAAVAVTAIIVVTAVIAVVSFSPSSAMARQPREVSTRLSVIQDWNTKSEAWRKKQKPLPTTATSRLLAGVQNQLNRKPELVAGGDGWTLGADSPTAYAIGQGFILSVPVRGPGVTQGSLVEFTLDQSRAITSVDQIVLQDVGALDRGRMTTFRNGTLTEDVIVVQASEADVQAPAGAKIATTGVKAATKMATRLLSQSALVPRAGWSWSKFNACLANMGVAAWAVTAISIACGFACPSTGPECLLCLVAAGYITQGVVTYCFGKAFT